MYQRYLINLYRSFLLLFPSRFRNEFGEEMEMVFEESLDEANIQGELAITLLNEFSGLPAAALRQHLHRPNQPPAEWEGPPSLGETLLTLGAFLLPLAGYLIRFDSETAHQQVLNGIAVVLGLALLAGSVKGFPRWSLPSLGLALSTTSFFFVFQRTADRMAPAIIARLGLWPQNESAALLLEAGWAGLMWLSLFALTFLALGILAVLKKFHPLIERIRKDWTLASFTLYSGTLVTLVMADEQAGREPTFILASTLCLAVGAWLYLRSPRPWLRSLALLTGLTLALWTAIASQRPFLLAQEFGAWVQGGAPVAGGSYEVRQTFLFWLWISLAILAPALLRLIPGGARRNRTTG